MSASSPAPVGGSTSLHGPLAARRYRQPVGRRRPGCHHLLGAHVGAAGAGREPDRAARAVRARPGEVVFRNEAGAELAGNADRFVSRLAAGRYLGYLPAQKAAMTGESGAHTNRP
jgi:hypothetical protein